MFELAHADCDSNNTERNYAATFFLAITFLLLIFYVSADVGKNFMHLSRGCLEILIDVHGLDDTV